MLLSECEVCRELGDVDYSFSKYGWPENTTYLEPAAGRLELVDGIAYRDVERHHFRRCSVCGTYYQYDLTYEYLVNGSEDTEELRRLTPTQARRFLTDEDYTARQAEQSAALDHTDEATRRFAARCVFDERAARGAWPAAGQLLEHADPVIAGAALSQLEYLLDHAADRAGYAPLKPVLAGLAAREGRFDSWAAQLLRYLPAG